MPSNWPFTFRLFTLVTTIPVSVVVTCLSADLFSMIMVVSNQIHYSSAVAIATGVLTILTVALMLIIDKLCQGSIFSYIGVEIVWLTILWVLWLGSGSFSTWAEDQIISMHPEEATCYYDQSSSNPFDNVMGNAVCHKSKVIIGFSFILWILLMAYTFTLLVLTLRAKVRGHRAWKASVRDGVLLRPTERTTESAVPASQVPVAQTHIISTPYVLVPATSTQLTTIPQSYSQAPATHAPSYSSPAQRSLPMFVSPSIPQV